MAEDKKPKKVGRPMVTLTPEQMDELEDMYAHGLSIQLLCDAAGVSDKTLTREMGPRLKRAKAVFLKRVARAAGVRALDGSERMIELILHTQAGWTKSDKVDITSGGEPLAIIVQRRTLKTSDDDNL
jgi:hypothetical protein